MAAINLGPRTWALVVGIDEYDDPRLDRLKGAVADAIASVKWLRRLGVPDGQIFLHASSSPTSQTELNGIGLPVRGASEPEIWSSIVALRAKQGDRLMVFLSGHGLYEPAEGRLFLTQEAGIGDAYVNLGIDEYINLFLSMSYARQFLFLDGCQNYPYSTGVRPSVTPAMHPGVPGQVPQPANSLVACYAAGQGERAVESGGRGLFLKRFLEALDLIWSGTTSTPSGLWSSLKLDWTSGCQHVDLRALMEEYLSPIVAEDALKQSVQQRPRHYHHGGAGPNPQDAFLLCQLPLTAVADLELDVDPPHAVPDVTTLHVLAEDPPYWSRQVPKPPATSVSVPVKSKLPQGTRLIANCRVDPAAPWDVVQEKQSVQLHSHQKITFQLVPRSPLARGPGGSGGPAWPGGGPIGPTGDDDVQIASIKLRNTDGSSAYGMGMHHEVYPDIERELNETISEAESRLGVSFEMHEDGPILRVPRHRVRDAQPFLDAWETSIRKKAGPGIVVVTTTRGGSPTPASAVHVRPPASGQQGLAGPHVHATFVRISMDDREDLSEPLSSFESDRRVELPPGRAGFRIDLPWGTWTENVMIPVNGEASVTLPSTIGDPPLRVQLPQQSWPPIGWIAGLEWSPDEVQVEFCAGEKVLDIHSAHHVDPSAVWGVRVPSGVTLISILWRGKRQLSFPVLPKRAFFVSGSGPSARVEPLSTTTLPGWDRLVAQGDLDALSPEDVTLLTYGKWEDSLLGLAGAYALLNRRDQDLRLVLDNLDGLPLPTLDRVLLRAELERRDGGLSTATRKKLRDSSTELPVMRWGVLLALALDDRLKWLSNRDEHRQRLERIQRRLAPRSTWTAWG